LILDPEHSLIAQSRRAAEATFPVNGDGFGVGWYCEGPQPGVFRDTQPAWNDSNLASLAAHTHSGMFMAHIRYATGTPITRTNCHPFAHQNWLFQHNGQIGGFDTLRYHLDRAIAPEFYSFRHGSTDSESMFLLALTFGLQSDPIGAISRMVSFVEQMRDREGIEEPFRMTIAAGDGTQLFAARHASHGLAPSLYHSRGMDALVDVDDATIDLGDNSVIVVSEPVDDSGDHWETVEPGTIFEVSDRKTVIHPLHIDLDVAVTA
jgi:glutamine amidotransferase